MSETAAANHEKTATRTEEAHQAIVATGRAAHDESAAAGATTATAHVRPPAKTTVKGTVHVTVEDEAATTVIVSKTEAIAMHLEVPAAAHQHPQALADPTLHPVAAR